MPEKWRQLVAVRPVYGDRGNACELWLRDGRVVLENRSIDSTLKALWRFYELDIRTQRMKVKRLLERKTALPFYLPDDRVFCPVKMRMAQAPKDRVNGYVDFAEMEELVKQDGMLSLRLKSGHKLMVLAAAETVLLGREMSCKLRRFLGCKPKKKRPADQLREQAHMETRLLLTVTEMIAAIYEQVCEKTVEYR